MKHVMEHVSAWVAVFAWLGGAALAPTAGWTIAAFLLPPIGWWIFIGKVLARFGMTA
jgi:hypothetical protein